MPYWLTRFWKIFFSGCQKVSGTRNLAIFFLWKSCHRTYWLISKAIFSFLVRGKKNSIFTYSMNFDFTPCTWVVKYLFQTCFFFFVAFPGQKRFSHSKLKNYVPEFYTMYMSFQIFVAICGMKCWVCTHNVPFVSSASARPEFEYRSQIPADTVIVLHEIYFRHDKPSYNNTFLLRFL